MTVVAGGDALANDIIISAAIFATATGSANAYVVTLPTAPSSLATGLTIIFKANFTITGSATVNVNSLGAKTLKKHGDQNLIAGDIKNGDVIIATYDGTNFQIQEIGRPQVSTDGSEIYAASSGGSDTYAITLAPAPTAYATGMVVRFKADVANTGAATLNVNSLGAKTIKKNYNSDLEDNDILANQITELIYDGTNFQLISPPARSIPESFTASDNLKASADTERTHTGNTSFTKKKEIKVRAGGTVRVKFDKKISNAGANGDGRVYINDSVVGVSHLSNDIVYVTFSDDVTVKAGDLVQLYIQTSNGAETVSCRNFRIYYDREQGDYTVNTD